MDLLIDGEVTIQPDGAPQPFLYRGFRMVDEEKLRDLNGDQLRKINQNGILPLIIRPPLLAAADPRDFRPPDAAGQGAGSRLQPAWTPAAGAVLRAPSCSEDVKFSSSVLETGKSLSYLEDSAPSYPPLYAALAPPSQAGAHLPEPGRLTET